MVEVIEKIEELQVDKALVFQTIYFKYYEMLYNLGFQYLKDKAETKEILQSVFLKLWEIRGQLKAGSNIRNYLFTLVKNNCLNAIKRKQLILHHHENIRWIELQYQHESLTRLQYDDIEVVELKEKIDHAVMNLPQHCQKVFRMCRFENLKIKDIALQLDVTTKTVEAHLTKALKILRNELKDYLPGVVTFITLFF